MRSLSASVFYSFVYQYELFKTMDLRLEEFEERLFCVVANAVGGGVRHDEGEGVEATHLGDHLARKRAVAQQGKTVNSGIVIKKKNIRLGLVRLSKLIQPNLIQ